MIGLVESIFFILFGIDFILTAVESEETTVVTKCILGGFGVTIILYAVLNLWDEWRKV